MNAVYDGEPYKIKSVRQFIWIINNIVLSFTRQKIKLVNNPLMEAAFAHLVVNAQIRGETELRARKQREIHRAIRLLSKAGVI